MPTVTPTATNSFDKWVKRRLQYLDGRLSLLQSRPTGTGTVIVRGGAADGHAEIRTVMSSTTLNQSDHTILCDCSMGAITVNLPAASASNKKVYYIKKIDETSNAVTIDGDGTDNVDGGLTATMNAHYEAIRLHCDGSDWYIF